MKRSFSKVDIAMTLARAVHDPECPAGEVISNPWLFRDIMNLVVEKPKIEFIMVSGGIGENTTEFYSISTNSRRSGPDLPQARYRHATALVDVDDGRNSHRNIFIIGGHVDGKISKSVVSLTISKISEMDPAKLKMGKWKVVSNLKKKRMCHEVGVVDGKIFVIGGNDGREYLKTIEVFSVKEGKWLDSSPPSDDDHVDSQIPPDMSTARDDMGVAVIGKKIFVIGGHNDTDGYLSTVEVLDTETSKWSTLPSMKIARSDMGVAVTDDRFIWIFGGWNDDDVLDSIEIFDVEKNEWSVSSIKMTCLRVAPRAIAVGRRIFIADGALGPESVEILDTAEMKWFNVTSIKESRQFYSAVGI
jgi:hypothetical protein